jgi:hypothetical protein
MRSLGLVTFVTLALGGCDLFFTGPDDCVVAYSDIAPADVRNPQNGQCEPGFNNYPPCDSSCGDCPLYETQAPQDWGQCFSGCEGLIESTCIEQSGCRAVYNANSDVDEPPRYLDCWAIAPSGPAPGTTCEGLDAYECSRHDDCSAYYDENHAADPSLFFQSCRKEKTPGCFDDSECGETGHCTTSDGECLPPPDCVPGQACPAVCFGRCVNDAEVCAVALCEAGTHCRAECTRWNATDLRARSGVNRPLASRFARPRRAAYAFAMGVRGVPDDDRTVDLGPRTDAPEFTESLDEPYDPDAPVGADPANATRTVHAPPPTDMVHGLPTQQLPARSKRASSHATPNPSLSRHSSTAASPVEAMRQDEVTRTRIFLKVAIATSFAGVVAALITGGDPIALRVVCGSIVFTCGGSIWMLRLARDVSTYTPRKAVWPALLIAFGAFGGVYYWGVASPVAAMLTYGIYFFSLGVNARIVTAMYILVAILHGLLGGLMMADVLVDRGLVSMANMRPIDQLGVMLVIEFLYFITFFTARISQRATLEAMTQLEQSARTVAQRDALLAEARAELDRALKIGGPGRFTEQQVGKFKLGVLIGRGGMGEVYEAHGVDDNREAAVKLLHAGTLADPTHVQRFIREAQDRSSTARTSCACSKSTPPPAKSRFSRWSACAATTSHTSSAVTASSSSHRPSNSPTRSRSGSRPRARPGSFTAISNRTTCSTPRRRRARGSGRSSISGSRSPAARAR